MAAQYFLTIQNENPFGTLIEHRCTTSLGLTMLSLENLDHKIPLVHADAAMYEAKRT
jgi:GGDEF domain-containing protein